MSIRTQKNRAIFLDRDGTLLQERGYLAHVEKIKFYPQVVSSLRKMQEAGFKLVVLTNQSGIGRGYLTHAVLRRIHKTLRTLLRAKGIHLSGIYYCPHLPSDRCACRKPNIGMVIKAGRALNLDVRHSYVVGDQARDMELAHRIGAKGILVLTGAGRSVVTKANRWASKVSRNLEFACRWILDDNRSLLTR